MEVRIRIKTACRLQSVLALLSRAWAALRSVYCKGHSHLSRIDPSRSRSPLIKVFFVASCLCKLCAFLIIVRLRIQYIVVRLISCLFEIPASKVS